MFGRRNRFALAMLAGSLMLSACASGTPDDASMASSVTFTDSWASSADAGMAAVFGTFTNSGRHDAVLVSGQSPSAARVELHEVTHEGGAATMRPKEGGITVAAGGEKELRPGGDHLMLMELTAPLRPGADVAVTVTFADGSTLPVTAQVRDFAGGNEEYTPGTHDHG